MNHIELFAGCGGMTLGLELAGFELTLANELSPMASETFAFNILGEDLEALAKTKKKPIKTFWITSKYESLTKRLRENPFEYPPLSEGVTDIPKNINDLKGKLIVGDIITLNQLLKKNRKFSKALKTGFGGDGIDLVSGGPPCQSFSLAGLRKKDCDKNTLPWEFANFVETVQPKFALLENVTGILRAFKEDGVSYHAWFEIAKVFASKGYIPLCLHVNARLTGVPQNRPRFIMLGVRNDIYKKLSKTFNVDEITLFDPCIKLYNNVRSNRKTNISEYTYYDALKPENEQLYKNTFLHTLIDNTEVSVKAAIDDLRFDNPSRKSKYIKSLNKSFSDILGSVRKIPNHEPRSNSNLVKRRFRIYQVIQSYNRSVKKEVTNLLKQNTENLTKEAWLLLKQNEFLLENGKYKSFTKKVDLVNYFKRHPTKKLTQKALIATDPAPAALSIPDDACHYHPQELRTLTVREMARIQSFPDSFTFRSKITTGGKMRRFEVPQYTQVGNAVPPLLGFALGATIKKLLNRIK